MEPNGHLLGNFFLILTHSRLNIKFLFLTLNYRPRKNKPGTVPVQFVWFLRVALSKMAGHRFINPELIDLQFWAKMPLKFSAVRHYDKSLVMKSHLKKKKSITTLYIGGSS